MPEEQRGTGVLVLSGSSGRVDEARARLFAEHGCLAEAVRWFGGAGQQPGPWEVPLETVVERVDDLRREVDRVVLVGTSFGAEAALVVASVCDRVDAVVAVAPSDVVWAGLPGDGRQVSHWTLAGRPLPFVPIDDRWVPDREPPAFRSLYETSRAHHQERAEQAAIAVERIPEVVCVVGCDDLVWPSEEHAERIRLRRAAHGLPTVVVSDPAAGHRVVLPGEPVAAVGHRMARGGSEAADRRLGRSSWTEILRLL